MNNSFSYGYPPSNNSSYSSFSASTPSNNTRFQRPRFAYAGPPSYPRPRSSASKPNPTSYTENYQKSGYESDSMMNYDSYGNDMNSRDYSHGYMDSMRNNYGDSTLPLDSLSMNKSRDSFNNSSNSSAYYTCNESFHPSPQKSLLSNYQDDSLQYGLSNRSGLSLYSDYKEPNTFSDSNVRRFSGFDKGKISSFDTNTKGLSGGFLGSLGRGSIGTNTAGTFGTNSSGSNFRGKSGQFGQNSGNTRGHFQKKKNFSRANNQHNPSMASKSQWRCELCSINFTSNIPLEMHLRGAKHAKKLKTENALTSIQGQISQVKEIEKPDGKKFYCEVCSVIANSSLQLQMHFDGTKHKAKLQQLLEPKEESKEGENKESIDKSKEAIDKTNESANKIKELNGKRNGGVTRAAPAEFGEPQPTKMSKFSCDICSLSVNSDIQLQQHLSSKKHQAKVEGKVIVKRKKNTKEEGDSEEPMQQDTVQEADKKNEVTNVVGIKTLTASFVQGETLK